GGRIRHLPFVLREDARFLAFRVEIRGRRHANRESIRIGPRIGGVEVAVAGGERERSVLVVRDELVERQVLPARTELQVVVAFLAWQEPGEGLIELVGRILPSIRARARAVAEGLVRELRRREPLAGVVEVTGVPKKYVLVRVR